jgi:flagellar biosynthesis protein FlhF
MHLKRYRRENVQEALRAVREDLGPNALVLSTRTVRVAGPRGWMGAHQFEITAAAERPAVSGGRHRRGAAQLEPVEPWLTAEPVQKAKAASRAANEIVARLEASGMDSKLAQEIAAACPAKNRRGATTRALRATLIDALGPLGALDEKYAPVEVFIGPPGAGKTTTIAKIAAKERATRGQKLGLLSADGFRVGAVEQLRLYAEILGAPFSVARSPQELESALSGARRHSVLLDTAGRSPSANASRDMFRVLSGRRDVRTHLVVPATTTVPALKSLFERFDEAQPNRVVITKLDEAGTIAPLLGALRERGLPISYLGTGQNVPEHLEPATGAAIAAWVTGDADARRELMA